ncbi:hypothetical protein SAMN06265355_12074 [Actinomadura mexicana]|uniref:Uncharacterized protein n=1 Tax=Actinomadura mexicana TaxID=134959 RepID=A0A239FE74_9ACTN|nr:hypothetical protein SAMN06265355_12074 [Actinomadura mexicana]
MAVARLVRAVPGERARHAEVEQDDRALRRGQQPLAVAVRFFEAVAAQRRAKAPGGDSAQDAGV